jgi:hypothetical protein
MRKPHTDYKRIEIGWYLRSLENHISSLSPNYPLQFKNVSEILNDGNLFSNYFLRCEHLQAFDQAKDLENMSSDANSLPTSLYKDIKFHVVLKIQPLYLIL